LSYCNVVLNQTQLSVNLILNMMIAIVFNYVNSSNSNNAGGKSKGLSHSINILIESQISFIVGDKNLISYG